MSAARVLDEILSVGLVPVIRTHDKSLALRAARAVVAGGVRVIEITLTVPDALSAIAELRAEFSDHVLVGAGSVLTREQASECIAAGAQFVVSPGLVPQLVETVVNEDVVMMPGALTATEVMKAWSLGSHLVKVFPCSAMGGARYIKQLAAPLPQVKLLPSGGITLKSIVDYVSAGAAALGVGGEIVDQPALARGDDEEVVRRARSFLKAVSEARAGA
jgi:2-dehydro-3-deoxyphosphogluconate aldolase/(4S)-4-hydroxy-2-oxoglutarate aldolase